eukprot:CAMPEP_0185445194 /NCGR_PEP_ID=MMETSP1365-20130426/51526_1 /TAXON_ID=38817 /ORGANISM="Gephyrocapsa oceanica, Strain RCC1303" /LENGTH=110 /DNA_ID=CAMNT_0028050939 /DNA_START=311 /DNA_END=642 /DNA_ORIENTATION=-
MASTALRRAQTRRERAAEPPAQKRAGWPAGSRREPGGGLGDLGVISGHLRGKGGAMVVVTGWWAGLLTGWGWVRLAAQHVVCVAMAGVLVVAAAHVLASAAAEREERSPA